MGYRWDHVALIGVGLLGGSIGLALREAGLAGRITGVGRDADRLADARARGCVTSTSVDLAAAVGDADVIIVATPVDTIVPLVRRVADAARRAWLITDVGSVKREIVESLSGLPTEIPYIGSHPLAGSEQSGCANARADLFHDRVTFVTPAGDRDTELAKRAAEFWNALGSSVEMIDPVTHDEWMAMSSHLPHVVASALAASVGIEQSVAYGRGFLDTTRLASGSVAMWVPILMANREPILEAVRRFQETISDWERALDAADTAQLAELLTKGKENRDALGS